MFFLLVAVLIGCPRLDVKSEVGPEFETALENAGGTFDSSDIDRLGSADGCDDSGHVPTAEICDYLDNDCDGEVDEDIVGTPTWYADNDGDGSGDSASTTTACFAPDGYVNIVGDCNDNDSTVFTGAPELCDGLDNDCNGVVDDNCVGFFVGCLLTGGR